MCVCVCVWCTSLSCDQTELIRIALPYEPVQAMMTFVVLRGLLSRKGHLNMLGRADMGLRHDVVPVGYAYQKRSVPCLCRRIHGGMGEEG